MTTIQQNEFLAFVSLLNENDLLPHVVLVGSWAEYLYQHGNVLEGFISASSYGYSVDTFDERVVS